MPVAVPMRFRVVLAAADSQFYPVVGRPGIGVSWEFTVSVLVTGTAVVIICSRKHPFLAMATRFATAFGGAEDSTCTLVRTALQWAATSPLRMLPDSCQSISTSQLALRYSIFRTGAYRASWASSHHPIASAA